MILLPTRLAGRYQLRILRPNRTTRIRLAFPNLILDNGLDLIASSRTWLDACQVGDGLTLVAEGQTALESLVAGTVNRVSANSTAANASPFRGISQITWEFAAGDIVGDISEVGVGPAATGPLFSRSRILDHAGNPTTVEVLSDEIVEITYQLSVFVPEDDVTGTLDLDGESIAYTLRAASASNPTYWAPYNANGVGSSGQAVQASMVTGGGSNCQLSDQAINTITNRPGGNLDNYDSATNEAYVAGTYQRQSVVTFGTGDGNYGGGIGSAVVDLGHSGSNGGRALGAYQIDFDPNIVKSNEFKFSLTITHQWGRA